MQHLHLLRPNSKRLLTTLALGASLAAQAETGTLEEIVVSASLGENDIRHTSYAVLDNTLIGSRNAQHLEDVLSAAANVNSASGASRGRFFQIRGIGERSQFVEPINASVAMLLDGIDLTGIGGAGLLFDLEQVEVLRGPQGTLFGANALAGLINLQAASAGSGEIRELSAGVESYGGRQAGLRVGGGLADNLSGRLSAQQYRSDGYIDNTFLDRRDTNQRDETQIRGQLQWDGVQDTVRLLWQHLDIDNGYDAFSLDNTRETLSDQPGRDALDANALMLRWNRSAGDYESILQASAANSDSEYSYDEDWSFVGIAPDLEYSSFDQYLRNREMRSLEWRIRPADTRAETRWVIGTYLRDEDEQLTRNYTFLPAAFNSQLDITTTALFGQVDTDVSDSVEAFAGLRVERRDSDYQDSAAVSERFSEDYWSGRAGLRWQANDEHQFYTTVSRGVRAGGFNASLLASLAAIPPSEASSFAPLRFFSGESLLSLEAGWQFYSADGRYQSRLAVFEMRRRDQQVRGSLVVPRGDGSTQFIDYTDNAARGNNRGLEWQGSYRPTPQLALSGTLGLLDARFDEYRAATGENLSNRDQPQAPDWQYALSARYDISTHLTANIELTGMDSFFFSDRHDVRSPSRTLLNASVSWSRGPWQVRVWGRNLGDEDTFVRGFGTFGNDPRKGYALEAYRQFGEPRVFGATLAYNFAQ